MPPRKQRGRGEGSIYRRKDGRWTGVISLGAGKRKAYYGKTRKEVAEKMNAALTAQQQGTLVTTRDTNVGDFLNRWLEDVHKPELRASSYRSYRYVLDKRLIPAFGHLSLQKLTARHLETQYATWRGEGLSNKSISKWHGVLHKALDKAMQWELIGRNVADVASPGKIVKREYRVLTPAEAQAVLKAAETHGLDTLLLVMVATGMRKGEMKGLRWSDVSLEKKMLTINRTSAHVPGMGLVENAPKTAKGRRVLLLPDVVVAALRAHRDAQKPNASGVVFPNPDGHVWQDMSLHTRWKKILVDAGLPDMRMHDLRHSAATILLEAGVPIHVVQQILGHASIRTTIDTYGHLSPPAQSEAAQHMERLFGERKTEKE